MANNQVTTATVPPAVGVPIADVNGTASGDEKRRKKEQARAEGATDSIEILKTPSMAGTAEGRPPKTVKDTAHQKIQQARTQLELALGKTGVDLSGKVKGDLSREAETKLASLKAEIEKKKSGHADPIEIEDDERKLANLQAAYEGFQAAHLAEDAPAPAAQTASGTDAGTAQKQLDGLWKQFGTELKEIGLDLSPGERDVETIQKKLSTHVATEVAKIKKTETELKAKLTDLQEKLKTASPEEKAQLETQIKAAKEELAQRNLKGQELQQSFEKLQTTADSILRLQAEQDLNGTKVVEKKATLQAQSVKTEGVQKKSPSATATGATSGAGAGSGVTTQSATSALTADGRGEIVSTASVGGGEVGNEGGPPVGGTLATASGPLLDTTGTTMSIQSVGANLKSEARKTDKALKKLLAAIQSGNVDAISTALILLSKRSGQILASMGAQVVKVMAVYQKQQGALQATLGKLDPKAADYNAKMTNISIDLQKGNADRQTFAEFLRTAADLREEVSTFTHGYITKMGQISSALARFQ